MPLLLTVTDFLQYIPYISAYKTTLKVKKPTLKLGSCYTTDIIYKIKTYDKFIKFCSNFVPRLIWRLPYTPKYTSLNLLLQWSRVSKGYWSKLVTIMEKNTFKWSLAAVDKYSPISGFIMWHSKLLQKVNNICAVHKIFFFKKKMEELLMPVAIKSDLCAIRQEVFSL